MRDALQAFEMEQLSAARERVVRVTHSPPPAGLEAKVTEVNQRWEQLVKHTKDRSVHGTCGTCCGSWWWRHAHSHVLLHCRVCWYKTSF